VTIESRVIAHLDMDAFYASIELLHYPELRGSPLVVGGRRRVADEPVTMRLRDYRGRGVVTTSTYEARALGVFSGMGLMKAALHAPDALLLAPNFEAYRHYSARFKNAAAEILPFIEDRGIDEIYLDLTPFKADPRTLGQEIKAAVRAATGLSCSIGISTNKLLAKIASDLEKPDGLTWLGAEDIPEKVWPLAVGKINGVGPKAVERLAALGIFSIGALAATDEATLAAAFGRRLGHWLHECAHGRDDRPVASRGRPKSLSRETTFERDLDARLDRPLLSSLLNSLCERLARDLQTAPYGARTIGIKLRYADFRTLTREITLAQPTNDALAIKAAARECLKRVPLDRKLRLLGIRAGGLWSDRPKQQGLQEELPFFTIDRPIQGYGS